MNKHTLVEYVLRRITLDTSAATPAETLAEFVSKVEPFLTQSDRLCMLSRRGLTSAASH